MVPLTAQPTAYNVLVGGRHVAFDAYNIIGSNYFKLRDLAYVLAGTGKQFSVECDAGANAISLTSGAAYMPVGGEMLGGNAGASNPIPTASKIILNGKSISLTAYIPTENREKRCFIMDRENKRMFKAGKANEQKAFKPDFAVLWVIGISSIDCFLSELLY